MTRRFARRGPRLAAAAALLLLFLAPPAGCARGELRALESAAERLRAERDALGRIAADLDALREKRTALAEALARAERAGASATHEERLARIDRVAGVAKQQLSTSFFGWRYSGRDAASLAAVVSTAGAVATQRLERWRGGSWEADVPSHDYDVAPTPGVRLAPPRPALPAPGRFGGKRAAALRAEIDSLLTEIEALRKVVGDLDRLERLEDTVKVRTGTLSRPNSLQTMIWAASVLQQGKGAPCQAAMVEALTGGALRIWCTPGRPRGLEETAERIRARFADAETRRRHFRLGPLSIDAAHHHSIQGTLAHEAD